MNGRTTFVSLTSRGAHLEFQMETLPGTCAARDLGVRAPSPEPNRRRYISYESNGRDQFAGDVTLKAGARALSTCDTPLPLHTMAGERVGELDPNIPFQVVGRGTQKVQVKLEGLLSKLRLFVPAKHLDACR
ncbi:MAG: hypothetical protein ACO1OB_29070 [Archangium sp.]